MGLHDGGLCADGNCLEYLEYLFGRLGKYYLLCVMYGKGSTKGQRIVFPGHFKRGGGRFLSNWLVMRCCNSCAEWHSAGNAPRQGFGPGRRGLYQIPVFSIYNSASGGNYFPRVSRDKVGGGKGKLETGRSFKRAFVCADSYPVSVYCFRGRCSFLSAEWKSCNIADDIHLASGILHAV